MKIGKAFIGALTVFGLLCGSFSVAQENDTKVESGVIIVNQDGEKVDVGDLKKRVIRAQVGAQGDGPVKITAQDGKITITDKDGKKREIDISGAQSVMINQSVKTVDENGEKKTVSGGKAIIVGPDGERQEIELGGPLGVGEAAELFMGEDGFPKGIFGKLRGLPRPMAQLSVPGAIRAVPGNVGKYMIGVNCKPIPESLRVHLDLEDGAGLIVDSIGEDSVAAKAGMKKHDILLYADDTQLTKLDDLIKAVQTTGKEDRDLGVTAVRAGKEITFKIKPTERPAAVAGQRMRLFGQPMDLELQDFGPGIIVDPGFGGAKDFGIEMPKFQKGMEMQMKMMQEQLEQMKKQMKQFEGPNAEEMRELMKKAMEGAFKDGNFQFDSRQESDKETDKDSDQDSDRKSDRNKA